MGEIDARLAALAERFAAQAAETGVAIEDSLERGDRAELSRLSHSLAGRAGMFGYGAIGDAARAVEEAIDAGRSPDDVNGLTRDLLGRLGAMNGR